MSIKITKTSSCSWTRSLKANSCRTLLSERASQQLQLMDVSLSLSSSYLETQMIIKRLVLMEAWTTRASGDSLPASGCAARHQSVPGSERWGWLKCKETGFCCVPVWIRQFASLSVPTCTSVRRNWNELSANLCNQILWICLLANLEIRSSPPIAWDTL